MTMVWLVLAFLRAFFVSRAELGAENLALRQQLVVLQRSVNRCPSRKTHPHLNGGLLRWAEGLKPGSAGARWRSMSMAVCQWPCARTAGRSELWRSTTRRVSPTPPSYSDGEARRLEGLL